jgi:ribosomal protein S18 acetylase RimI-like enzyme
MQKNKAFYLKEIDGKIVGFISWGINDDPQVEYENEITWLYVDIQQQGKHIGKELFEKLIEDEKFKVCDSFYLRTLKDNPQSNHFYQKMWGKKFGYKNHKPSSTTLVGYCRQK